MSIQNSTLPELLDLDYVVKNVASYWSLLNGQQILITGCTGIIGKWMLSTLNHAKCELGLNIEVVVLSRDPDVFIKLYPELADKQRIVWLKGDVRNFSIPQGITPSWAIHAATDVVSQTSQLDVLTTCSFGTHNVVSQLAAANCKRMLMLSSGAIYGKVPSGTNGIPESFVGSVSSTNPNSAYAEGKRYAELLCTLMGSLYNITIPMARCFAMVGPYLPLDKHFAIGNFIHSVLNKKPIVIEGDGTPIRSYLYLADVATQLWFLLFKGRSTAYNIGSNQPISIKNLAEMVINVLDSTQSLEIQNKVLHGVHANEYYPDTTLFSREFKLDHFISIEESILRTANWYSKQASC